MPGQGKTQEELDALKAQGQGHKPTEEEKLAHRTVHAEKATVKFGNNEEEVDIVTETNPNTTNGYDVKVHLPFCPISSVTNE